MVPTVPTAFFWNSHEFRGPNLGTPTGAYAPMVPVVPFSSSPRIPRISGPKPSGRGVPTCLHAYGAYGAYGPFPWIPKNFGPGPWDKKNGSSKVDDDNVRLTLRGGCGMSHLVF